MVFSYSFVWVRVLGMGGGSYGQVYEVRKG